MPTLTGACVLLSATTSWTAEPGLTYDKSPRTDQVFRADELSLDVYGSLSLGEEVIENISRDRVQDNGRLGLGAGLNYFFSRNFGLSVEAYTENAGHSFVDDAAGSLVFRIPIDKIRLAPYVFGGGGYQFDPIEQSFAHVGAGLEYRFVNNMGVFLDGRYVFTEDSKDFGLARLGFRFSF